MKTKIVTPATGKLKKTDKKLGLRVDAIRRLSADPALKGTGGNHITQRTCDPCGSGTLHLCC